MSTTFDRIRRFVRSWDLYAIMFLIAWPFIYYWPITIGQKVFSEGDLLWFFLPIRTELSRALAAGRLPLWTPSLQGGFPLFAEGQIASLYPLNVLFHILFQPEFALSYTILFNLAWASLGMFLLMRSNGFRPTSAVLAGFVFGASGFMTAHISHSSLVAVASWLPWLILLQQRFTLAYQRGEKSSHWFILVSISIGLQLLAGYPPIALLNLAAFFLLGMATPFFYPPNLGRSIKELIAASFRQLPKTFVMTILSIVLGVGISGVQLLPLAEFAGFSTRGVDVGKAFFTSYSLEPLSLTQFVSPFWQLGQPFAGNMEFWAYLGILPLMLAMSALLLRRDVRTWVLLFLGLISLFLALGGFNPVYEWLYYIPVFNRFRAPARFIFLFTFAGAFLAGIGFEEMQKWLPDLQSKSCRLPAIATIFVSVTCSTIILAYNQPLEFWMEAWKWLPIFMVFLSIGIMLLAGRRVQSRIAFSATVLGLVVFDLGTFSSVFLTNLSGTTTPSDFVQTPRTVRAMDSQQSIYRVNVNRFPSVTQAAVRATLWSFLPLVYGKQGVDSGYVPGLPLQRNEEYIQNMSLPMRNLMNIRYYLLPLETAPPGDPTPFDGTEPNGGLTMDLLKQQPDISPTRVASVEIVSYTDQSTDLPDGSLAGELMLTSDSGKTVTLPIRLGIETAEWAYDGIAQIGKVNHSKPSNSQTFPAYLASVGREFQGRKYVARYNLDAGITATAVGARSLLADNGLKVESVSLIDEQSHSVSLATLLDRNELTLAFRSHTAAMWENKSVMPRAFMVHAVEFSSDAQTLSRMQQSDFRPDETLLLDEPLPLGGSNAAPQQKPNDQVQITQYQPERVVIDVNAGAPGYLVLTDSWYPGWVATIDGKDAPIVRADYIFRALAMPAGQHTVVFEYKPMSLIWGAVISGLSIIVCIGLAIIAYLRARRRLQNENHLVTT